MLIVSVFNRSLNQCLGQNRAPLGIQILLVTNIISRYSDATTAEPLINLYEHTQHVLGNDTKILEKNFFTLTDPKTK